MPDQDTAVATPTTETAPVTTDTLLSKADQPVVSENETVLDTAGAEEKAAREAENKRILEADEKTLTVEEKTTRAGLLKVKQEAADKAAAEIRAKGVPEKYDLKPPEGLKIDEVALAKITPIFKEAGLTNAQAQIMANAHAKLMQEAIAENEAKFKEWNEANTKETMKTLGTNAKSELAYVAKVKNMLSPETIDAINASGIGNIKAFILDMAKIGKLFSEEKIVDDRKRTAPGTMNQTTEQAAEKLYPSMAQK